jgi:hypothetical protein
MSTPQEYWDACLIRTWRNMGTIHDVFSMFYSITGKKTEEFELKRLPKLGVPTWVHVRVFTAQFLPKINDWLWDKTPEKDVVLLKKLSASKYDTLDKPFKTNMEKDLSTEMGRIRTNRKRMAMNSLSTSNRNQATDWGVTKGGRIGRKR